MWSHYVQHWHVNQDSCGCISFLQSEPSHYICCTKQYPRAIPNGVVKKIKRDTIAIDPSLNWACQNQDDHEHSIHHIPCLWIDIFMKFHFLAVSFFLNFLPFFNFCAISFSMGFFTLLVRSSRVRLRESREQMVWQGYKAPCKSFSVTIDLLHGLDIKTPYINYNLSSIHTLGVHHELWRAHLFVLRNLKKCILIKVAGNEETNVKMHKSSLNNLF